jgi:hypothetical protein
MNNSFKGSDATPSEMLLLKPRFSTCTWIALNILQNSQQIPWMDHMHVQDD